MAQMFDRINFMSRQRYPSFSYVKPAPTHQNLAVKHDQSIHQNFAKSSQIFASYSRWWNESDWNNQRIFKIIDMK